MPNWHDILTEIAKAGSQFDIFRRNYIKKLHEKTNRNVIIYYSGWLQKSRMGGFVASDFSVNDADKNGFMTVIHNMDRTKGLDLILHTPGGEVAATESLVDYLRSMFKTDIRAIVPQLAMSAGTMIACACKEIIMGKESSLGPIDPIFNGLPAHGVVEEFETAYKEVKADPAKIPLWQPIISRYHPTLIGECKKSIKWAETMVKEWLKTGMFLDDGDAIAKAKKVYDELGDHSLTLSHSRHISFNKCKEVGLNVQPLESDPDLQDAVLSVHHACIHTLSETPAVKIIENHNGIAYIIQMRQQLVVQQ